MKTIHSPSLRKILAFGMLCAAALLAPRAYAGPGDPQAPTLNIGDPAPAVRAARWVKGSPVPSFQKGRVYVVEFWATWCGPCKANIPHLTELAKQYRGKAEIIGMNIWESDDPKDDKLPKVKAFVKSQGAAMDYTVGADTPDGRIAQSWMKAAGESGIPTAFIVGKDGRIAWIGNPAVGLDKALPQVIAGTFDVAAAKVSRDKKQGPSVAIQTALNEKAYAEALRLIDSEISRDPVNGPPRWAYSRFTALSHLDLAAFKKDARALLAEQKESVSIYNLLCAVLATEQNLTPDAYQFGLTLVDEALAKKERAFLFYAMGAAMHSLMGDKQAAIRMQEASVKAADEDPNVTPEGRERQRKALENLKAAAGNP